MLQRVSLEIAYCHERAAENRRMADSCRPEYRQSYLDLEARWLRLALHQEFSDQLNAYVANIACRLDDKGK